MVDAGGIPLSEVQIGSKAPCPLLANVDRSHTNMATVLDVMQRQADGFYDDFHGNDISALWTLNDTSSAGAPTHAPVDGSHVVLITLAADSEAEVVGYDFNDVLTFDIDEGPIMIAKIKTTAITTAEGVVVGLGAAWNDTLDSSTAHAWFRLVASMALVVETDDGTNDNDDVATGVTMVAAVYKYLKIDVTDSADVRFYTSDDGLVWTAVATSTTFDMSNYTDGLQPMFAVVKASGTTTPTLTVYEGN
jgi:hypothetical protein